MSEVEEPVKVLEAQGTFDEMMVWGHEILPAADDTFVKGVEEWVRFAETVCASPRTSMNMVSELTLLIDARVGGAGYIGGETVGRSSFDIRTFLSYNDNGAELATVLLSIISSNSLQPS